MKPAANGLEGRVALVTGGNRGIGAAIALALAADGADVAVNYRRDEDSAHATAKAIEALGRRVELYQASVDDLEADGRMVEAIVGDFGGIDILVHSAGIASRGQSVVDTDPEEIERVWRVVLVQDQERDGRSRRPRLRRPGPVVAVDPKGGCRHGIGDRHRRRRT